MKKTNLFIFDGQTEYLLAVLSNDDNEINPYWSAPVEENLNGDFIFEFITPHNEAIREGNLVAFKDADGDFQLFQIYKTTETHIDGQLQSHAWCEHAFYEMVDDIVEDLRVVDGTALEAMTKALSNSRWQVGNVADLGTGTVNFYYSPATQNLQDVVATFGGELKYRVTIDGNKITGRFVDLLPRRGSDTGKRFEWNKDLVEVNRTVQVDGLKTALYGRGSGEQIEETGGYTRKVTFADVVWVKANGDPVDKPAGQEWIGDPDALERWGRVNSDGTKRHRFGTFDVDTTDPNELIQKTWEQLQQVKNPLVTYELKVLDLERLAGYSWEKVRLGDTVFVIDTDLNMRIEARVIKIKYDLDAPENAEIVLGNFIEDITDYNSRLSQIEATLTDRKGVWDKNAQEGSSVDDSNIVVEAPQPPSVFSAQGLFKTIILSWEFDPSIKISAYEVYGSQVQGFTPDSSNLLFRGKTGGYTHNADTNQTWYFRIRALNPHGDASAFTQEFSATTIHITTPDFEDLSVTNEKVSDLSADKITFGTLDGNKANIIHLNADNIDAGLLKAQFIQIGRETTYEFGYDPTPVISQFYDATFTQGKTFWSEQYVGQTPSSTTVGTITDDNGETVWSITGEKTLYSVNALPIKTNRVYQVSFKVKQTVDPTTAGTSNVSAGVVLLDKNFQELTGTTFGAFRAVSAKDSPLTVADGVQEYTGLITGIGDDDNSFGDGTIFIRPFFKVNATGGDGTVEVYHIKFEDVTEIQELQTKVNDIDLRTTEDQLILTITQSQTYQDDMASKANTEDLGNYATTDDLNQVQQDLQNYTDQQIQNIDFSPYATTTYVDAKAGELDFKFSSSGGVNLLKNSVGYAGTDFWDVTLDKDGDGLTIGSVDSIQNAELEEKGVGSGFVLNGAKLSQTIVISTQYLTISTIVKKGTAGSGYLKVTYDNGLVEQIDFPSGTAFDYELKQIIIEPVGNTVVVELYGDIDSGIIFTGTMVNVGNVALQWQHSAGEVYNTNVLMDLNGIRVFSNSYNGYTAITPEEFAGYAEVPDENNNLVMTKVFTLNKDTTEMTKAQIDQSLTMSPLKMVTVKSTTYNGLAFIAET